MPHVSLHASSDDWQREAVRLANIITKGPGTTHARVDKLRQALIDIAAENYNAGKAEAMKAAPAAPAVPAAPAAPAVPAAPAAPAVPAAPAAPAAPGAQS